MPGEWEAVQKKTFTKWCNNHLSKRHGEDMLVKDILSDWDTGIKLMSLAVCLYSENEKQPELAIKMPKLTQRELAPKNRIAQVNNCDKALKLLASAGVKLRVSAENLVDHDTVNILGMVWMIILDYAARGFGGSSAEVKRALLEWVNKKTDGYEKVNPPGVKNFSSDWRSGLAFCALIHRHRPNMIDYQQCLGQSNAENLEMAFDIAEKIGIPRLLDVEDVDVDKPDDKSVLTYVMEYFNAFAGDAIREAAAKQAADWLSFLRGIRQLQFDYETRSRALLEWVSQTEDGWKGYNFGDSKRDADKAFDDLRSFVGDEKPPKEMEKMDCEALFTTIQTTLNVNKLSSYSAPADCSPDAVAGAFDRLNASQSQHSHNVRENKNRFIEKKDDSNEEEAKKQIEESFKNYDKNSNGVLSKEEFLGACMELGVVMKTQEEKDQYFEGVSQGKGDVSFEQYSNWVTSRVVVKMDSPDAVKNTFKMIANGAPTISAALMATPPITDEDREFLMQEMPDDGNGNYDYSAFVDKYMS
jgi:Ca2+-binding EF-hand superfamily protein